ncbi:CRISPR-associated helicase Cas3' [Crossiella cryophila]|uniref:CRISPR-associated helicase Cas3' n=1 Tax=Crossiella cryophila TaxID=43355 RepID=UPI0028AB909C|nr:CRISPR-associated helicase Cas3' [Crossiella cryophila]
MSQSLRPTNDHAAPADAKLLAVWAKSVRDEHGALTHWLPLHQHLDDTGAVARRLLESWVPRQVLDTVARDVRGDLDEVRVLLEWLTRVHDVGKASPAFAVQVPALADRMRGSGLSASPLLAHDRQRSAVTHALVGHVAVREWLAGRHGLPRRGLAAQLAVIVGSHHGVPPEERQLQLVRQRPELAGTGVWKRAREHFLERADATIDWARWRDVQLSLPSQVLLTGLVIVADWIASNTDLFPLLAAHEPPRPMDTAARLEHAWQQLDLPGPWSAELPGVDAEVLFGQRFAHPNARARPVQVAAVELARRQERPGLLIIEAPMGNGKTEAALLAAEVLAARSGAGGCFVALPTQATTDAMFSRVHTWLEHLPRPGGEVSVTLAHGKASLNEEFAGLVRAGYFASVDEEQDSGAIVAHQWLRGRKKGVLASFVVGTIDQILFAGLKSKHLMLRHLGLAGKVVIIDEVHAYDVFMSQYLLRVLEWLGAYRVPVVLLSATLPAARRAQLLASYDGQANPAVAAELGYPVLVSSGGLAPVTVPAGGEDSTVVLNHLADDLDTLVAYLRVRLAQGGCAVVVRNTVTRVQETAQRLEEEFGAGQVTINHSRFLACDRARIDQSLLRQFGPRGQRPGLHIVVASQVVEQSLDVDFDLMVTDLAPMDLVLQRLGRLHRHLRDRPDPLRQARCALVGVGDWDAAPVQAVAGSRRVYGDHTLLRAAALLAGRAEVVLPRDISPLVQQAYGEQPLGPVTWQEHMQAAEHQAAAAESRRTAAAGDFRLGPPTDRSLVSWVAAGVGDADDDHTGLAQVRDGAESLEVLVVQRDSAGGLVTPEWIARGGGEPVPVDLAVPARQAAVIAACSLRLPLALSHPGVIAAVTLALETNYFTSFQLTPLLKGQLVLVLDENRKAVLRHGEIAFTLTYDPRRGLIHERA